MLKLIGCQCFSALIAGLCTIATTVFPRPAMANERPAACCITVVEKGTGWPVPMVELRTTHHVRFISDNAGHVAFDLPELMGQETWFDVTSDGYEVGSDGFGQRGVRVTPSPVLSNVHVTVSPFFSVIVAV